MPKPAITGFSSVAVTPSATNQNNGLYAPELTQAKIDSIPGNTLKNGAIVYNTTTNTLQSYENNAWVNLVGGAGAGDVVGPIASVDQHIAIFNGVTGKIIEDGGVVINFIPAPVLQNSFRAKKAAPLVDVNQIGNLGNIQFVNDVGLIFVDSLMPLEFITNDIGGGNEQVCSLFTGGLPSSSTTPSALVELQTTTGALLLSRLTEVEKAALFSAPGMVLFNTDTKKLNLNDGNSWNELATTSASDNFASEVYLSSGYINDPIATPSSEIAWSPEQKIAITSCVSGYGISTSIDGINWIPSASYPQLNACIAWSSQLGLFSAIETSGMNINTSTDGLTWTPHPIASLPFGTEVDLVWIEDFNRFYTASTDSSNYIYSSIDGINYTLQATTRAFRNAAYGNGILVAVGSDGPQYSTDGVTWISPPTTIGLTSVTYSDLHGYFVAIPRLGDTTLSYTSVNGIDWIPHIAYMAVDKRCIVWIPDLAMFVVGGDNGFLAISTDGISFKQVYSPIFDPLVANYGARYISEWGEFIVLHNHASITRTAKRFNY